jgi:flagellar FlgN protein
MTELLQHLESQLESARRMLGIVLSQAESIRAQDVEGVLARLGDVQAEMVKRVVLERERDRLLADAASVLGMPAAELTLESLLVLVPDADATRARELSAELRGLLSEISRVHAQNRILIRQELAFLDHLMRVLSGAPQAGYSPFGESAAAQPANVVDMRV